MDWDHLFQNLIPNSIEGIKIFGVNDSYIKPQNYDDVTNLENRIWAELYQDLEFLLDQYASSEYLLGLRALPIPNNMFNKDASDMRAECSLYKDSDFGRNNRAVTYIWLW